MGCPNQNFIAYNKKQRDDYVKRHIKHTDVYISVYPFSNVKDGKIDIKLDKTDKELELSIIDNGGGVDKDIINRVFEPYFTTKHKAQGIGLGLYMVKNIIENSMSGDVSIENYLNGVKFTIKVKDNE